MKSQNSADKSKLGQGRECFRREMKAPAQVQLQVQFKEENQIKEQAISKQREGIQSPLARQYTDRHIKQRLEMGTVPEHPIRPTVTEIKIPIYPNPFMKLPPSLPDIKAQDDRKINLDLEINKNFEENSPYQEGIISEIYQRPDKSQFLEPAQLANLVNTSNIVQKYLPEQMDIDKILKIIQKKVLKATHLPITIKEIQVGYITAHILKIYICTLHNTNYLVL